MNITKIITKGRKMLKQLAEFVAKERDYPLSAVLWTTAMATVVIVMMIILTTMGE